MPTHHWTAIKLSNKNKKDVQNQGENQEDIVADKPGLWLPPSLTRLSLSIFGVLLLGLLVALVVLKYRTDQDHGLTIITSNHYTWTYGPTAILVLVTAYWRLVDYNCKALTPWAELAKGPIDARRSLLLDYVSPFLGFTVITSATRGHWAVSLTGAGFLLSKLVTIASTGLFFPSLVPSVPTNIRFSQITRFDNVTGFQDPGPWPFYTAYATLEKAYPLSEGADRSLVYESYRPLNDSSASNGTYQLTASALVPHVTCESVEVDRMLDNTSLASTPEWKLEVRNNSGWRCPHNDVPNYELLIRALGADDAYCPPRQLYPNAQQLKCTHENSENDTYLWPYFVGLSDVRYTQKFNVSLDGHVYGDSLVPESWDVEILKTTAILCTISHTDQLALLTYNMSRSQNPVQDVELLPEIGNFSRLNLPAEYLTNTLDQAPKMFGETDVYSAYTEQPLNTVLTMVAEHAQSDYGSLLDSPDKMTDSVQDVLHQTIIQILKSALLLPTNDTFQGSEIIGQKLSSEERLQVQKLSLIVMLVGVSCMAISIILVMFCRPTMTHKINPLTLVALAHTLQNSPPVQRQLSGLIFGLRQRSEAIIRQSQWFGLGSLPKMVLRSTSKVEESRDPSELAIQSSMGYSRPFTLSKTFLWLTFLLPVFLIGILEYLQHLSDTDTDPGIAYLSADSLAQSVVSRYIPAVVALLVATMFNCLDANIAILLPFSTMVDREVSNDDLSHTWLDRSPPMLIYHAVMRRQWAYGLTTVASVVGSILTIVTSGLYTVEDVPRSALVNFVAQDSWNMSFHQALSTDNGAALVSSLIETANLSYPAFTFDELVFPTLALDSSNDALRNINLGLVDANVPALRAELQCTEIPLDLFNYSLTWNSHYGFADIFFGGQVPLPDHCHLGSVYGNESSVSTSVNGDGWWTGDGYNVTYVAQAMDVHLGAWPGDENDIFYTEIGNLAMANQPDNPPGCPSMLIFYGFLDGLDLNNSVFRSMLCDQKIQKLSAGITLSLPELKISTDKTPVVDESTAEYLPSGPNGETSFWWRTEPGLKSSFRILNETAVESLVVENDDGSSSFSVISSFFRGAMYGLTPFPLETLQKDDKETRDKIFDHVQKFYRRYMAQYISANMRTTPPTASQKRDGGTVDTQSMAGVYTPASGKLRLMQAKTPKIVIQAMLGFMVVCASLALCIGRYHDLVPWNPCTIAGLLILFVDSKMCAPLGMPHDSSNQLTQLETAYKSDGGAAKHTRKGTQNTTSTFELTDFPNKLGSPGMKNQYGTETIHPLVEHPTSSSGQSDVSMSTSAQWERPNARFRLGWWNKGKYVGPRHPSQPNPSLFGRKRYDRVLLGEYTDEDMSNLRYGIDVLR
ncbi:hypothetical protein LTR84_008227 [Exophiala bonariae]|uniref:Uncharacterized protein n=1 Tax=Exophiala bonariae TaxID=1690606 RepID=A0AAV9MY65_9EURO|nr:hypothetical protein LTR84_008227 [Exophiala bonariae]